MISDCLKVSANQIVPVLTHPPGLGEAFPIYLWVLSLCRSQAPAKMVHRPPGLLFALIGDHIYIYIGPPTLVGLGPIRSPMLVR